MNKEKGIDDKIREFLSHDLQHARLDRALRHMIQFAANAVPYYQKLFERFRIDPRDIRAVKDLCTLPLLTKHDLHEHEEDLKARSLPPGEGGGPRRGLRHPRRYRDGRIVQHF